MSSDMWVKSGFDWSTFHRQLSFHHAAREGDCSETAAMLRRKHNDIRRCFETQVDCVNREHTQRRSETMEIFTFNSICIVIPPHSFLSFRVVKIKSDDFYAPAQKDQIQTKLLLGSATNVIKLTVQTQRHTILRPSVTNILCGFRLNNPF